MKGQAAMETALVTEALALAAVALVLLATGIWSLVHRKPLIFRARWTLVFVALPFAPLIVMTAGAWSSGRHGGELLVGPLLGLVAMAAMWFTLRGYTFIGLGGDSLESALRHALPALGIPFEESLSGVRLLDAEGGSLKVNLQPWTGTGALTISPGRRQAALDAIVEEMRRYFARTSVKFNPAGSVLYLALGAVFLVTTVVGWTAFGRLMGGGSRGEWAGRAAPDFRLRTLAGEKRRLSDEIGRRMVLVNFFATWCGPCRREIPELIRLQREHEAEGLLVLGVDADEAPEAVRAFAGELGITYPVGIDRGWIRGNYAVGGLPTTVVIGADGRVIDYRVGGRVDAVLSGEIENELTRLRGLTDDAREAQRATWSTKVKGAIPERLNAPRVLEDRLGLHRETFLEYEVGGELVTDIELGASPEWPAARALLTDREGARLVDGEGRPVKEWRFPERMRFPRIVRTDGDLGQWLLVDDGTWDEVKAVSSDGRVLWSRSGSGVAHGAAAGDLDGDGKPEFVVWRFDSPGLEVLDGRGSVARRLETPDPVRDVKILEGGSGRKASILYSILDRDLVELDPRGGVLSRRRPDAPALNFLTPVLWTAVAPEPVFIQTYWDTLNLLKPSGERVATLRAPSLQQQLLWVPGRAVPVRFPGQPDPYLIVAERLYYYPRTVLLIFDRRGALIYHELLEDQYSGLAPMTGPSGEADSFLLGGEGLVLRYARSTDGHLEHP